MAKINFLLQAVTADFHADALKKLLSIPHIDRFVAGVAFIRQDGIAAVVDNLKKVAKYATFFVGIRNEITSVQALKYLVNLGVKVFVVDTASRYKIFHPKVFMAKNKTGASIIIGSANMTFSGLYENIEAGAILHLNFANSDDRVLWDSVLKHFEDLPSLFPAHVFKVKNNADVDSLFNAGRLADEDIVIAPSVTSSIRKGERDKLSPMQLARHSSPVQRRKKKRAKRTATATSKHSTTVALPTSTVLKPEFTLVWESKALTERDLNIPHGSHTHATGSMLWKKGAADDIDQRHFFRDDVFVGLTWQQDKKLSHYERAEATFTIVVKGVNYGSHKLKLSHNTDTTSRTYKQKNAVSSVSWGDAHNIIAKRDLLGRIMSLYRKEGDPPEFVIEID